MHTAKDQTSTPLWRQPDPKPVKLADSDSAAAPSPAAQLQDQLHNTFDLAISQERWSYRRTAALLMVTCGGFWACVAALIANTF